jgi:hypothetical protein
MSTSDGFAQALSALPEDMVVNCQVGCNSPELPAALREVSGGCVRYHAGIDLLLPCEPEAGNDAGPEVNEGPVLARHAGVGVEHVTGPRFAPASLPSG